MPFIVKDLMISVLRETGGFGFEQGGKDCLCTGCTGCTGCTRCTDCSNRCTGGTPIGDWMDVINPDPTRLAELKQQLRVALAVVEARESALKEQMRPQTLEEAQALEDKLVGALEEVRAMKSRLEQQSQTAE